LQHAGNRTSNTYISATCVAKASKVTSMLLFSIYVNPVLVTIIITTRTHIHLQKHGFVNTSSKETTEKTISCSHVREFRKPISSIRAIQYSLTSQHHTSFKIQKHILRSMYVTSVAADTLH